MTDAGAPLSRRERRLRAQQQAQAAELGTGDIPTQTPDGRALSRRERRALERSEQPMETWTAEEEMIATGQLPAMTPDVIAEQERLAKRKAEEAAEEAARTSAELRRVSLTDAAAAPVAPEPVQVHAASEAEPEQESAPEPAAVSEPVAEVSPAVEHADVAEPTPEPAEAAETAPPAASEWDDLTDLTERLEPVPASDAPAAEPEAEAEAEAVPAPAADDPANAVPESLRHLFPPGSLQARLMAEGFAASRPEPTPEPDTHAEAVADPEPEPAPQSEPAPEPQPDAPVEPPAAAQPAAEDPELATETDPAEEFRRLTAQAMAGLERASRPAHGPEPEVATDVAPAAPAGVEREPTTAVHESAIQDAPPPQPTFPSVSGEVSVHAPSGFSARSAQDAEAASQLHAPVPAPSPWEHHPLQDADAPSFDPNEYVPSDQLPRPDLTQLLRPATGGAPQATPLGGQRTSYAPPVTGAIPQAIAFGQAPTTTGSIPITAAIPVTSGIEVPEEGARLNPAGGARDFRWAHLAVLCAVAFVCGVLVWQLAGPGS